MKYILFVLMLPFVASAQEPVTYVKTIALDTFSKYDIYDRALVWCSKSFVNSKSAIRMQEREGGVIAGKANYTSNYKVPGKKDSVYGVLFSKFSFDWLMEIKDGKLRFTITELKHPSGHEYVSDYTVTTSDSAPYEVWLQPKRKTDLEWQLSKQYLIYNLDKLLASLQNEILSKSNDW